MVDQFSLVKIYFFCTFLACESNGKRCDEFPSRKVNLSFVSDRWKHSALSHLYLKFSSTESLAEQEALIIIREPWKWKKTSNWRKILILLRLYSQVSKSFSVSRATLHMPKRLSSCLVQVNSNLILSPSLWRVKL